MITGFRLDPLDTLLFRDGRPFNPGMRAVGNLPNPQVCAGAVRSSLLAQSGFDLGVLTQGGSNHSTDVRQLLQANGAPDWVLNLKFCGPWLALANTDSNDSSVEPLIPVPMNLKRDPNSTKWFRLDPLDSPIEGWDDPFDLKPVWCSEGHDAKHPGGFLTSTGVSDYLAGRCPKDEDWFPPDELFQFDHRTGIGIDPDRQAVEEGQIYGVSTLALCQKICRDGVYKDRVICIYFEVIGDLQGELPTLLPLGGEGHYVSVSQVDTPWKRPSVQTNGRSCHLLVTSAFLGRGVKMPTFGEARLVAAAVGQPEAYSGWDTIRGGPRPTRFAVPAGSTYFVEGNCDFSNHSICTDAEDIAQGWGVTLQGVWNYV